MTTVPQEKLAAIKTAVAAATDRLPLKLRWVKKTSGGELKEWSLNADFKDVELVDGEIVFTLDTAVFARVQSQPSEPQLQELAAKQQYTVAEAAILLGVSTRSVYFRIRGGQLPTTVTIGDYRIYVSRQAIINYWADYDPALCPDFLRAEVQAVIPLAYSPGQATGFNNKNAGREFIWQT